MIRLLRILIGAALIAAGLAWIADRQGELVFTLDQYQIRTSAGAAIGLLVAFTIVVIFAARIGAMLLGTPGAFGRWFSSRRTRRGNEALSRGLVAVAAGEAMEARRLALKAKSLLGSPPLALLLTAQAAQLDGDDEGQLGAYRAMLKHPETEFLALRGLFMQAMRRKDNDEAMSLAARAHTLKPRAPWAINALFDLKCAHREWSEAKAILEDAARAKLIDAGLLRRRRAVLLAAEALDAEGRGDGEHALALAVEALALSPGLSPAAVLAARKLTAQARAWRAQDVIEAAWAQGPHPDLAAAYALIKPGESAEERAERLKGLARLNRDHFESRMLEAEQAVSLAQWGEARRVLSPLARGFASARVCALMAEIEQGEYHDAAAAHAWISRAVRAPRDAEWRCTNCGWNAGQWHAVCGGCGAFDTLSWLTPDADSLELLRERHSERFASDAGPAFLQEHDEVEDTLSPQPRNARAEGMGGRGFVVLPRPPDDPGPGGTDFDPPARNE